MYNNGADIKSPMTAAIKIRTLRAMRGEITICSPEPKAPEEREGCQR